MQSLILLWCYQNKKSSLELIIGLPENISEVERGASQIKSLNLRIF